MSATIPKRMTGDEFIAWATQQPDAEHYELVSGVVVTIVPERALHGRIKATITHRLMAAIDAARLPCETYVDSMATPTRSMSLT